MYVCLTYSVRVLINFPGILVPGTDLHHILIRMYFRGTELADPPAVNCAWGRWSEWGSCDPCTKTRVSLRKAVFPLLPYKKDYETKTDFFLV